jgi:hypothetical protein
LPPRPAAGAGGEPRGCDMGGVLEAVVAADLADGEDLTEAVGELA